MRAVQVFTYGSTIATMFMAALLLSPHVHLAPIDLEVLVAIHLATALASMWPVRNARAEEQLVGHVKHQNYVVAISLNAANYALFLNQAAHGTYLGAVTPLKVAFIFLVCAPGFMGMLARDRRTVNRQPDQPLLLQGGGTEDPNGSRELPAGIEHVEDTGVTFADVVGQDSTKIDLEEAIRLLQDPGLQSLHGVPPVAGIVLHGPPGTGKTFMAKAAAGQFGTTFLNVNLAEVRGKYVGDTEKRIRAVFQYARAHSPAILFLDEFDTIARDRSLAQASWEADQVNALLQEIDGIHGKENAPIVIAATNHVDRIDPAVLRAGRLDRHVYVGPPDAQARHHMWHRALGDRAGPDIDLAAWVAHTDGWTPADITGLVVEAKRRIMREPGGHPRAITNGDLVEAANPAR